MKRATTTCSTPSTRVQQMQLACVAASFSSQHNAAVIHYTARCTAPTAGSSTPMNAEVSSKASSHYRGGGEESHTQRTTRHQHQCQAEQGRSCRHSQQTACHPPTTHHSHLSTIRNMESKHHQSRHTKWIGASQHAADIYRRELIRYTECNQRTKTSGCRGSSTVS